MGFGSRLGLSLGLSLGLGWAWACLQLGWGWWLELGWGEACAQSKCRLSRSMSELIEGIVMKQKAMHALTKAAVRFVCRPCTMVCVCIASLVAPMTSVSSTASRFAKLARQST